MTERSERVWVALMYDGAPIEIARTRGSLKTILRDRQWVVKDWGITIRRATLTLDPVKPKRRAK